MSKIICEVCGTRYPDSSEQCPICGCINGKETVETAQEAPAEELVIPARPKVRGGRFSKANVRKRLKNQTVYEEVDVRTKAEKAKSAEPEADEENDEEYEEESGKKGGTLLNVLLVLVIVALLAVSGYIFVEFFMPNFFGGDEEIVPSESIVLQTEEPTQEPTEAPEPTEPPTVPCQELVLDITDITLREEGAMYLLNVQVLPEDSTDEIMYLSSNPEVASINEEGRITAVSEGSAVIAVFCGEQQIECNVVCNFSAEEATEESTEEPTEAGVVMTVTSTYVNIRAGAGTKYEKVGKYNKGDQVVIYEQTKVGSQYWGRTDDGWICMDYVK